VTGRRALAGGLAGAALVLAGTGVALVLLPLPPSPRGPEPGRSVYQAHCATCHGVAGRGDSWRARLLFLRAGDLATPAMASLSDQYLADLVRHGGSSFGKPGMPSFGFVLSDAEIEAVIQYVRTLVRAPRDVAAGGSGRRGARPLGTPPDAVTRPVPRRSKPWSTARGAARAPRRGGRSQTPPASFVAGRADGGEPGASLAGGA
jgi:mono/diheme cytochrome c family protein